LARTGAAGLKSSAQTFNQKALSESNRIVTGPSFDSFRKVPSVSGAGQRPFFGNDLLGSLGPPLRFPPIPTPLSEPRNPIGHSEPSYVARYGVDESSIDLVI